MAWWNSRRNKPVFIIGFIIYKAVRIFGFYIYRPDFESRGRRESHRLSKTHASFGPAGEFCGHHMRQDIRTRQHTELGGQRIFPAAANGVQRRQTRAGMPKKQFPASKNKKRGESRHFRHSGPRLSLFYLGGLIQLLALLEQPGGRTGALLSKNIDRAVKKLCAFFLTPLDLQNGILRSDRFPVSRIHEVVPSKIQ
jgi:hypothetical protein